MFSIMTSSSIFYDNLVHQLLPQQQQPAMNCQFVYTLPEDLQQGQELFRTNQTVNIKIYVSNEDLAAITTKPSLNHQYLCNTTTNNNLMCEIVSNPLDVYMLRHKIWIRQNDSSSKINRFHSVIVLADKHQDVSSASSSLILEQCITWYQPSPKRFILKCLSTNASHCGSCDYCCLPQLWSKHRNSSTSTICLEAVD